MPIFITEETQRVMFTYLRLQGILEGRDLISSPDDSFLTSLIH